MIGDSGFGAQPQEFWALVRTLSEHLGYTHRTPKGAPKGSGALKTHTVAEMALGLNELHLDPRLVEKQSGAPTSLGSLLEDYFRYRAELLTDHVEPQLMDKSAAEALFEATRRRLNPRSPIPMNKQKGEKREPAYLTALVNMLVEQAIGSRPCDFDPRQLTTFTNNGTPLRTLARRVDGAFPSAVNPIAVWEIKEYYFTTTFGSRVADGVYETLLDGLEMEGLEQAHGLRAQHALFVDAHFTWWVCGKSYLCRIVDMLNMGLVDEVVFGREVTTRVPQLAAEWARHYDRRGV